MAQILVQANTHKGPSFRPRTRPVRTSLTGLGLWVVVVAGAFAAGPAGAQQPRPATPEAGLPAEFGVWIDDTGKGAVEILPCEGNVAPGGLPRRLCGRIVWLQEPTDKAGQPLTDGYNPRPALRKRPICGLQVIGDARPMRGGSWDQGWIYDPKEGKSYDVEVRLRGPGRLAVTGYLGVKFLSETFIWRRAPADLPRCDAATQARSGAVDRRQARR